MDLLEIDPKLFITCRLCLEDTGVFQIVPNVQQQIKYCFDINVEPFDGLPQLLCRKCNTLLQEYSNIKKIFVEKQASLKEKLTFKKEEPPETKAAETDNKEEPLNAPDDVSVSENNEANLVNGEVKAPTTSNEATVNPQKKKNSKSKRRRRALSLTSNDSYNSNGTVTKDRKINHNTSFNKPAANWKTNDYLKYYVCKICSLMYRDKRSVKNHYYDHNFLIASNHQAFEAKCRVYLPKLDNKPNITGLNNTVVFSKNRILLDDGSDWYNIVYVAKDKRQYKSDSSDSEFVVSNKQRKRRRLSSLSSNDTVYIGNTAKSPQSPGEKVFTKTTKSKRNSNELLVPTPHTRTETVCIELDDSSDSNMDGVFNQNKPNSSTTPQIDLRTIENIITVCRNKFEIRHKKQQMNENHPVHKAQLEAQLKHKILSFGRKTLNVSALASNGILRYLEHKNLNVIWEPVSQKKAQSAGRELSFVRIAAINFDRDKRVEDDSGWVDVTNDPTLDEFTSTQQQCVPIGTGTAVLNIIPTATVPIAGVIKSPVTNGVNQIVLTDVRSTEESNSKKLLNVNPVANPKQLPKKSHVHEAKPVYISRLPNNFDQGLDNEPNMIMPVITSTKSLAAEVNDENKKKETENSTSANNSGSNQPAPRIKVKPASELMKPQLQRDQSNSSWDFNQIQNTIGTRESTVNLIVPDMLVHKIHNQSTALMLPATPASNSISEPIKSGPEYIILDTVDMPNTKTASPFEYFRNLLLLHGLTLIEANAVLTRDFLCLLKFKVQFKQENKNNPVILCLSLHCSGNEFCMSIKDGNQINIHIGKMSPNWQWEIMKVYQGDVSTKVLLNAQKAGQSIYTNANTFVCLLRSITQKQEI
ncbi:uncharacterized protein LOC114356657 [Ostrinia furnacalis]|uniref:uncharacterized protein LOC114356657 n=1 Tax=Ostrinia furnacalis TaxID=93504 RepID=UPI00103F4FE0|nr:uncharacterized protein LOC114356657 [Ostrinia furnacalis]